MSFLKNRVLMVATSRKTKGGITAVLKAYEGSPFWRDFHVKWLETHADGNKFHKLLWAIRSYFLALFLIPRYNIIHIHLSEVPSALRKTPFFILSKIYRKKVIIHFHSFSPKTTIGGPYKKLYFFLFSKADKIIVLSQSWKRWVNEYLSLSKHVEVVYNPCEEIEDISPMVKKENIILYAGALNERKGYKDLIKAFHKLAKKNPTWKLVLAGNGQISEANKLAKTLSIDGQVETTGWITGKEKDQLFRKARIFCLPSYAEGFPTAILDACSYGIAFITTPVGGIPDIITDKKEGLLFAPGDIDRLAGCLQKLINDVLLRDKLSLAAKELSNTIFNLKSTDCRIRKIYDDLLTIKE